MISESRAMDIATGAVAFVAFSLVISGFVAKAIECRALDISIAVLALVALAVCVFLRRWRSLPRGAPFVPGHWLFGNLPELLQAAEKRMKNDAFFKQHQRHGKTYVLNFPLNPWAVKTSCPKNVEHVLKTNFENYDKGERIRGCLSDLLGCGIFNSDGHQWHSQRKIASHMFTASLFKEHIWVVVRRNARKLRDMLEASDPSKPVDVFNLMNRFTLDSMGEIGFGKCIGSLEDPSSPFMLSFDRAQEITFWRFGNPLWKICRYLGIYKEKETQEHFGSLDAYSHSVVRELRSAMDQGSSKSSSVNWADMEARKSFVGLFLEDARKRGEDLSDDFLRDLMMNFLMAGRDHAAQALSWTVFCLCQNPEAEEKARREVIDVCGIRGPAYDDMPNLPYLTAVINEALRLYPSMPIAAKCAMNDDTLPDGTFVPRGTTVMYDIFTMGRDRDTWGEDADAFRPERWQEMQQAPGNFEYPVFNAGPRECLGRRLAMIEMKTCLAFLLPQVSFRLAVPAENISEASTMSIGMESGLPCFICSVAEKDEFLESSASTALHSECATSECCTEATSVSDWTESEVGDMFERRLSLAEVDLWLNEDVRRRLSKASSQASDCTADECRLHAPTDGERSEADPSETPSGRQRSKKRKGGYSRKRKQKFWARVRESTPERWPEMD